MTEITKQKPETTEAQGEKKPRGKRGPRAERPVSEFDERVVEVSRVTRVVKGGKRLRFRVLVVIGDRKGRVAFGLGKAGDVSQAVQKAVADAKKDMRTIVLKDNTTPFQVIGVHKSARVLIKPAGEGSGLIAGGPVRIVLQLAGVKDAVAKMLGSKNKISNVMATINALDEITAPDDIKKRRLGGTLKKKDTSTKDKE